MVLIDSSVWVSFLQSEGELQLVQLLGLYEVLMHDMVQAEIAIGSTEQQKKLWRYCRNRRNRRYCRYCRR